MNLPWMIFFGEGKLLCVEKGRESGEIVFGAAGIRLNREILIC